MTSVCRRLEGRVAVVTGGASGIGRATASRLLAEGACVVVADIDDQRGEKTVEQLSASGAQGRVVFCPCDVAHEPDVLHAVRTAVKEFGRLDCMVNNAGIGGAFGPIVETHVEDWDRTQEVLLRGVFLGVKHAARQMIRQGSGGSIVNVSSVAALSGGAGGAAYTAAKAGVLALTRCAAVQLARHRIRCNAVLPGTILTPLIVRQGDAETMKQIASQTQPWPEPGMAEDIAAVVAFLASDDSRFVTGEGIVADGGIAAAGPNIYRGDHPLGEAIKERMLQAGVRRFDPGTAAAAAGETVELAEAEGPPRRVLITGVSRGLGAALAAKLVELGHTVLGCSRSEEAVRRLQERWGPPHRFDVVDVSDDAQVKRWAERLTADGLVPDLLINNAAVTHRPAQIWRLSSDEFAQVLNVNVLGVANVLRHFVPAMLRRGTGIIVNFSSGWGREAAARVGPYCASKWAIEGLTRVLAEELPPKMAAVSLHPGIVNTDALRVNFGEAAARYPTPEQWAEVAAPYILAIRPRHNGKALSVPGMTEFRGM